VTPGLPRSGGERDGPSGGLVPKSAIIRPMSQLVLIVDDEPGIQTALANILEDEANQQVQSDREERENP